MRHGPKFETREGRLLPVGESIPALSLAAHPLLNEKGRAGRVDHDHDEDQNHYWKKQDKCDERYDDIENAFGGVIKISILG